MRGALRYVVRQVLSGTSECLAVVVQCGTGLGESFSLPLSRLYIIYDVTTSDFMIFLSQQVPVWPVWTPKPSEIVLLQ